MKKQKIELRYYDIPHDEFLFALFGKSWRRDYGHESNTMHFHNLLEIGVCLDGTGILKIENREIPYHPGMLSIIPPNVPHHTVSALGTQSSWEYIFIDVSKMINTLYGEDVLFRQRLEERINKAVFFDEGEKAPEINLLVNGILQELRDKKDMLYREAVRGMALALLIWIARLSTDTAETPKAFYMRHGFEQVRPALELIQARFSGNLRVSEIAAACHVSESHFRRLFEEAVGMTPVEYINHIRIREACTLIRKKGISMEDISSRVGFSTVSTFNRNFKRITGMSPYQWKKQPDNYESRLSEFNILVEKGW